MIPFEEMERNKRVIRALHDLTEMTPTVYLQYCLTAPDPKYMDKPGAFIWGAVGVGKTTLAFQIAREMVRRDHGKVTRITASKLMIQLKDFGKGSIKEKVARLKHADILVLDDLGAEKPSEFSYENIYEILNFRAEWCKYTIITSNKRLGELDDRIASRIVGLCSVVNLTGKDLRLKNS